MQLTARPSPASDEELLHSVAQGDREAFIALYDRFAPRMLGLILTVVRDRAAAEDVLQRVLLEVWQRHAARYLPALGAADAWMLRLAKSRAIDHARSQGRDRAVSIAQQAQHLTASLVSPEVADHDREALVLAINNLSEEERVPIVLAYFQGLTREEIADHCGTPVGTIKTRIRRAMTRLHEHLTPTEVSS